MTDEVAALLEDPGVQEKVRQASDEAAAFLRQAEYFFKDHGEDCEQYQTALKLLLASLRRKGISVEDLLGN